MKFSQGHLLLGAIVGSLFVALFGYLVASGISPLPPASTVSTNGVLTGEGVPPDSSGDQIIVDQAAEQALEGIEVAVPGGPIGCGVRQSFPDSIKQWCELITKYSIARNLDPNLIAAMMLQESGGDHLAYSKSGAVGLMQVMPRDGLAANFMCVNGPCFASRPSTTELQDPEYNLEYSTGMMASLINRHGGSVRDALKAYGPMDVDFYYADKILAIYNRYQ